MLVLGKEAEADMAATYVWYEARRSGLGRDFVSAVEIVFNRIELNPKAYAVVSGQLRRALCERFPYSVYFAEGTHSIRVIGVLHQNRSPSVWQAKS